MTITLYVKTHNKTGLKYFGKTERDPMRYRGSGLYWLRHLAIHGYDVTTEIIAQFEDQEECTEFAIKFSEYHDIVKSESWANLRIENGADGAPIGNPGHEFTEEERQKIAVSSLMRWQDPEQRAKIVEGQKESWGPARKEHHRTVVAPALWTDNRRRRQAEAMREVVAKEPDWLEPFLDYVKGPRSEAHKEAIKIALTGQVKSESHKRNLSWAKIKDKVPFKTYEDFAAHCLLEHISGKNYHQLATNLSVAWVAISKAVDYGKTLAKEIVNGS